MDKNETVKVLLFEGMLCSLGKLIDLLGDGKQDTTVWTHTHGSLAALKEIIDKAGLESEFEEWKNRILNGEGGTSDEVEGKDQVNE